MTPEEVTAAFKRLKRHKAAGIDGIKAEFLLDAEDILTEPLAKTFSQMLSTGVPQTWCSGVIHPIFKSGDTDDPNNYRGITVTSVLAKVFAMILETRMMAWAEGRNLRAQGQAGFRSNHRTVDNQSINQSILHPCSQPGQTDWMTETMKNETQETVIALAVEDKAEGPLFVEDKDPININNTSVPSVKTT